MEKEKEKKEEMEESNSKSQNIVRCAKAAMLLSSLRTRRHHQEKEIMKQTIDDLKMEIVHERSKSKNLKLCNLIEFAIQIIMLFSFFTFFLSLAFKSC